MELIFPDLIVYFFQVYQHDQNDVACHEAILNLLGNVDHLFFSGTVLLKACAYWTEVAPLQARTRCTLIVLSICLPSQLVGHMCVCVCVCVFVCACVCEQRVCMKMILCSLSLARAHTHTHTHIYARALTHAHKRSRAALMFTHSLSK